MGTVEAAPTTSQELLRAPRRSSTRIAVAVHQQVPVAIVEDTPGRQSGGPSKSTQSPVVLVIAASGLRKVPPATPGLRIAGAGVSGQRWSPKQDTSEIGKELAFLGEMVSHAQVRYRGLTGCCWAPRPKSLPIVRSCWGRVETAVQGAGRSRSSWGRGLLLRPRCRRTKELAPTMPKLPPTARSRRRRVDCWSTMAESPRTSSPASTEEVECCS